MSQGFIYALLGSASTVVLGVIGFWVRRFVRGTDSSIEDVERDVKRFRKNAEQARVEMQKSIVSNAVQREQGIRDDLDEHVESAEDLYARKPRLNRFEKRMERELRSIDEKLEKIIEMHLDP